MRGEGGLIDLHYRNDALSTVQEMLPQCYKNITALDLTGCHLGEVPQAIAMAQGLEALFLDGNGLTFIPPDLLAPLKSLRVLSVNDNLLDRLPASLALLQELREIQFVCYHF